MADKQMDLFKRGGLLDEGGAIDEESGNEVPTGSLKEEVRDDIPAQLSEGEFVLPADVVRYHGLDKIMALRDEAKMGLARMEAMGQMGNAEEATIPDNVPFDIEDLEIEDDDSMEMQVGGYVPGQQQPYGTYQAPSGTVSVPSQFASYAQQIQPASQFQPFGGGQTQQTGQIGYTPTFYQTPTGQPGTQYTFQQMMPTVGGKSETREYRNEAGQSLYIPFVNGQPVYPIPEGYTEYKPEAEAPTEEATTAPTTVAQDTGGNDRFDAVQVGGVTGQQLSSTKNDLGVTGSRGLDIGTALTAFGLVTNPMGTLLGMGAKSLAKQVGLKSPSLVEKTVGAKDPTATEALTEAQKVARARAESLTGQSFTGYVGTQVGDIDPVTGGQFNAMGVAVDPKTGFAAPTKDGLKSFNSIDTAKTMMGAALPGFMGGTGYYGGLPDAETYSKLSATGKTNVGKYMETMQQKTGVSFAPGSTMAAVIAANKTAPDTTKIADPLEKARALAQWGIDKKEAEATLTDAMAEHAVNTGMTASSDPKASANQVIGSIMAGTTSPQEAMQEQGISVSDFSSSTAAAQAGVGYSSYDEQGQPKGAAPKGSGYSKTGTFSSGDKDTSTGAGVSVGYGEGQVDPGLASAAASKEKGDSSGDSGKDGGSPCCFIMLEARYGDGTMDKVVRRYRDEHMTDKNRRGYYKLAEVFVPLMRKSKVFKWVVTKTFADPLVSYGKWYYGENKHGWIFAPVKSAWMKLFDVLGTDTKFIRENGEVV